MLKRYKEPLFGLLLGLGMWVADAVMHTLMAPSANERHAGFIAELLAPGVPQLITRLLYLGFAFACGWLLWRSNRRERVARELGRRLNIIQEQIVTPAIIILDECNDLLRREELQGEGLRVVKDIRDHARQIDDCVKDLSRRIAAAVDASGSDSAVVERGTAR